MVRNGALYQARLSGYEGRAALQPSWWFMCGSGIRRMWNVGNGDRRR